MIMMADNIILYKRERKKNGKRKETDKLGGNTIGIGRKKRKKQVGVRLGRFFLFFILFSIYLLSFLTLQSLEYFLFVLATGLVCRFPSFPYIYR
ncbi:hypothetical protein HOY80DRAFT_40258 [Tuber brumale]|nr:hypothetical protein HOY80DRAFT_40258 [Tuber brumale]